MLLPAGAYRFSTALGIRGDRTELVGLGGSRLVASTALDRLIDSNNFSYLRFHGLTIAGSGVQAVGGRGSIHLDGGSRYCIVSQCRIVNAPGTAIADDGTRNLIVHNVVDGTGEHGIYSSSGMESVYRGNHLRRIGRVPGTTLGCHGISIAGSRSCAVVGNAVEDANGVGIVLRDDARFCTVRDNAIGAGTDRHIVETRHRERLQRRRQRAARRGRGRRRRQDRRRWPFVIADNDHPSDYRPVARASAGPASTSSAATTSTGT